MKNIIFSILLGLVLSFISCSEPSSNEPKSDLQLGEANVATNSSHTQFLKDYEAFKVDYCKNGKLFKEANLTQKIEVAQKMVIFTEKLAEYNPLLTGIRASGDKATLARIDQLEAEIKQCDKLWEME
jgi:hypothetical protein